MELEGCHTDGETESPTASPTIPALRATPFHQHRSPVPPLLEQPVGKGPLPLSQPGAGQTPALLPTPQQPSSSGAQGPAMAVPRLDLSRSAHSTLEARNASAELQVGQASDTCALVGREDVI